MTRGGLARLASQTCTFPISVAVEKPEPIRAEGNLIDAVGVAIATVDGLPVAASQMMALRSLLAVAT